MPLVYAFDQSPRVFSKRISRLQVALGTSVVSKKNIPDSERESSWLLLHNQVPRAPHGRDGRHAPPLFLTDDILLHLLRTKSISDDVGRRRRQETYNISFLSPKMVCTGMAE